MLEVQIPQVPVVRTVGDRREAAAALFQHAALSFAFALQAFYDQPVSIEADTAIAGHLADMEAHLDAAYGAFNSYALTRDCIGSG